jgi:hypothetical protein
MGLSVAVIASWTEPLEAATLILEAGSQRSTVVPNRDGAPPGTWMTCISKDRP